MKIYTKTGDDGSTQLLGGRRVPKHHLRIEAYGTVDELNSHIGLMATREECDEEIQLLHRIQNDLFYIGSHLAMEPGSTEFPLPELRQEMVKELEQEIDGYWDQLPPLKNFLLPGGHPVNAEIHIARCVCRRAERLSTALNEEVQLEAQILTYLNRLSDWLFVYARMITQRTGSQETPWKPRD